MNPNRLTRELRKIPGNLRSPHLPGGTLVSAVLDRRLMGWSDRGGASRIFGDVWSEYCWQHLSNGLLPFDHDTAGSGRPAIVRLDANPRIALQAGRNKLPNPDFLVAQSTGDGQTIIRAIDAKFAIDHLRRSQISPESIRGLVEQPGSLVRAELERHLEDDLSPHISYGPGAFLGPSSILNNFFFDRLTSGEAPTIPSNEIQLVSVAPENLFTSTVEFPLMELLREIDALRATSPESNLVLGMYYLRLATAARWFETQSHLPLLSDEIPSEAVNIDDVLRATERRIERRVSAFGLIESWSRTAEDALARQKQVQDAARLPIRMSELRTLIRKAGLAEENKLIRKVRGMLEREFTSRLVEETGVIPASPAEPINHVTLRIRTASKALRPEMLRTAHTVIDEVSRESSDQPAGHQ